jgi:hypothetical protein
MGYFQGNVQKDGGVGKGEEINFIHNLNPSLTLPLKDKGRGYMIVK